MPLDEITRILSERGDKLNRVDLRRITLLAADVPLEETESLAFVDQAIEQIVTDPLYEGDIEPSG